MNKTGNIFDEKAFDYKSLEFSHGDDYLCLSITKKNLFLNFLSDRVKGLNDTNSNYAVVKFADELLSVKKYTSPTGDTYQFIITSNSVPVPLFHLTEFNDNLSTLTGYLGIIHLYGSYFRLKKIDGVSKEFHDLLQDFIWDCPISRIDYRLDYMSKTHSYNIPGPLEVLPNIRANKKCREYKHVKTGVLESWDSGNKAFKTIFIRCYNKKIELQNNLKSIYLYGDMKDYKTFHRLEYEFGAKYCAGFKYSNIEELREKVFATIGCFPSDFTGTFYKPKMVVDLTDEFQKNRYVKHFLTTSKNLIENGIDPIDLILQNSTLEYKKIKGL